MILIKKFYTRDWIRANPTVLVVFGDNLVRKGYGGQAGAARDEPNAVGIPTLVSPSEPASDKSYWRLRFRCALAFWKLEWHMIFGGVICWPKDGVGTGIANLQKNCPKLLAYIEGKIEKLKAKYGVIYDDE